MEPVEIAIIGGLMLGAMLIGRLTSGARLSVKQGSKQEDSFKKRLDDVRWAMYEKRLKHLEKIAGTVKNNAEEEKEESGETDLEGLWNALPSPVRLGLNALAKSKLGVSVDELLKNPEQFSYLVNEIAPKILPSLVQKAQAEPKKIVDLSKPLTRKEMEELEKQLAA